MPNILYEDNHVIVAVKPPNMLSQADKTRDADMLSELKEYIRIKYRKPGNVHLGLVHRLDRPVGGLMVFARTSKAAARLSAQMREHAMGREYLCVTEGLAKDKFTLINYLIDNERMNRVVVCDADERGAQEAILHGRTLARKNNTSLCALRLETGRKHQIRVQMREMGNPLWGDHRYGHGMPGQQIALWGYKLTFEHPTTHNIMTFQNLPCGSVWNSYGEELTDMAVRFANSAAAILQENPAPDAQASAVSPEMPQQPDGGMNP
ncbi:MAG: RluA family pseudouridine synthase [Clostridia bacterium]|nr:RluA family pseudouridine synthase [Clostridia bacterium]